MKKNNEKKKHDYDITVVGAGFIGLTISLMLAKLGLKICILESKKFNNFTDKRTTALSQGTKRIYEGLNIWRYLKDFTQSINDIVISEADNKNYMEFNSKNLNEGQLGFIIENANFRSVLINEIKKNKYIDIFFNSKVIDIFNSEETNEVKVKTSKILTKSNLLIGADGRKSKVRDLLNLKYYYKDYNQNAYIFNLEHSNPHNGVALERFFPEGPLAILPMKKKNKSFRSSVVWTIDNNLGDFSKLKQTEFENEFSERYQNFFGEIVNISKPSRYPLNLVYSYDSFIQNAVLVGDASQGIHPIAGQGFNLGMRDCLILQKEISKAIETGSPILNNIGLRKFETRRFFDKKLFINATDFLNAIFSNNSFFIKNLRKIGIFSINRSNFMKNELMRNAMGLRSFDILDRFV